MKWTFLKVVALGLGGLMTAAAFPAVKNLAVVVSASSRVSDVTVADLAKMCKGAQKTWPDGKAFTLDARGLFDLYRQAALRHGLCAKRELRVSAYRLRPCSVRKVFRKPASYFPT